MELANSSYLFTLATLSITFVGFTALVMILRQSLGSRVLTIDALVARWFMVWGFTVTYTSLIPVVLAAYGLAVPTVWRISSIVTAIWLLVINLGYPFFRWRSVGERTPFHVQLHVSVAVINALILLVLNATDKFPEQAPAIYATAVSICLVHASFAFVQHFGFMLGQMNSKMRRRK
jgi:hypothetical protein